MGDLPGAPRPAGTSKLQHLTAPSPRQPMGLTNLHASYLTWEQEQKRHGHVASRTWKAIEEEERQLMRELLTAHRCQKDLVQSGLPQVGAMKRELQQKSAELQNQLRELRNT